MSCAGSVFAIEPINPAWAICEQAEDPIRPYLDLDFVNGLYRFGPSGAADVTGLPGASFSRTASRFTLNSAGTYIAQASGVPGITNRGVHCERGKTNLFLRSGDATHAAWSKVNGLSSSASAQSAPLGGTAALVSEPTGTASTTLRQTNVGLSVAGSPYCCWHMIRPAGRRWFSILLGEGGNTNSARAWFDTQTGTLGTVSSTGTLTAPAGFIKALAGGWFLIGVSGTAPVGGLGLWGSLYPVDGNGSLSVTGLNGASFHHGHGQLEDGAFPSSPIVTTASSATRDADHLALAGLTVARDFAVVIDVEWGDSPSPSSEAAYRLYLAPGDDRLRTYRHAAILRSDATVGGVTTMLSSLAPPAQARHVAQRIDSEWRFALNGVEQPSHASAATYPSLPSLDIGRMSSTTQIDGYVRRIRIINARLTAAQRLTLAT